MSPTGLRGVLDGSEPYGRTRDRLRAWLARQQGVGELHPEAAQNILLSLVRRVPEPRRAAVSLLEHVARLHSDARVLPPTWVGELRTRLERPEPGADARQG